MKVGRPPGPGAGKVERRSIERLTAGRPPILDVLGAEGTTPVRAVRRDGGRILWFNWALAEELGLELPADRKMSPAFEGELLRALNLDVLPKGQDPGGKEVVEGVADYYGGEGISANHGSGRAAFFGELNLNAKGIGVIEEMISAATPFGHRHGGMSFVEGGKEAVWGEASSNLFSQGSTRILAVLDRGDYIVWDNGNRDRRAVAHRIGRQTRPGHLLSSGATGSAIEKLLNMFDQSGFLRRTAGGQLDLDFALRSTIEAHARASAEQFRHRILHGALSPSNVELDAEQIDFGTATSQPRTAPIRTLERGARNRGYTFDTERERRIGHLEKIYTLVEDFATKWRSRWRVAFEPLSVKRLFEERYAAEKQRLLVGAIGAPPEMTRALIASAPEQAERFAVALADLAAETNPVPSLDASKEIVRGASVADIYAALAEVPRPFFLGPNADLIALFREHLHLEGGTAAGQPERVALAIEQVALGYRSLLDRARELHRAAGGTDFGFERMIIQRAAFENAPTAELHRANLRGRLIGLTKSYEQDGDTASFQREIDRMVAHSLRNIEAIRALGSRRALAGGTEVIEERTIRGVTYGVHLEQGGGSKIEVSFPVEPLPDGRHRLATLDGRELDERELRSMQFKYTVDGWATHDVVRAQLAGDRLVFEIPTFSSQVATLEGVFYDTAGDFYVHDQSGNFEGYVFAVPDEGHPP